MFLYVWCIFLHCKLYTFGCLIISMADNILYVWCWCLMLWAHFLPNLPVLLADYGTVRWYVPNFDFSVRTKLLKYGTVSKCSTKLIESGTYQIIGIWYVPNYPNLVRTELSKFGTYWFVQIWYVLICPNLVRTELSEFGTYQFDWIWYVPNYPNLVRTKLSEFGTAIDLS